SEARHPHVIQQHQQYGDAAHALQAWIDLRGAGDGLLARVCGEGHWRSTHARSFSGCCSGVHGLTKKPATSVASTSATLAGLQRGAWSLSTARARMPSTVSLRAAPRIWKA